MLGAIRKTGVSAAADVSFAPTGDVIATQLQAAIAELSEEKIAGPASSASGTLMRFSGTTGKIANTSALVLNDSNQIIFPAVAAAPATTTRSGGTKLVLFNSISASTVDYAIGVESSHNWYSVQSATSTFGHKFYGGTTELFRIRGDGSASVFGTTASTSTTTGALTVAGGAGIAGALNVGGDTVAAALKAGSSTNHVQISNTGISALNLNNLDLAWRGVGRFTGENTTANTTLVIADNSLANITSLIRAVNGNTSAGGNISGGSTVFEVKKNGDTSVLATTASTSTTTGALTVAGGAGIAGALNVGGAIRGSGGLTLPANIYTAAQTLTASNYAAYYNSTSAGTFTLPSAATNLGRIYVIKQINTGTLTLAAAGTDTLERSDGTLESTMSFIQSQSITIQSIGTSWRQI